MIAERKAAGPRLAFSDVVVTSGPVAYITGQGPIRDGEAVGSGLREQAEVTLDNLLRAVESVGSRVELVARCTCYLADLADYDIFDDVYRKYFKAELPARTTIGAGLLRGILVEVDAIAAVPAAGEVPVEPVSSR